MAARKKTTTRKKAQYVRAKKRGGGGSALMAQRTVVLTIACCLLLALLVGVVMGFRWVNRKLYAENQRFEIQNLLISCNGKLTEEYIREMSGLSEGMNLFECSFKEIEGKLLEVSMIESVYLERKLPNTMIVKVKERVPVAQIIGRQATRYPFMVDRYGYVMPHRRKLATLPVIKGLDIDLGLGQPASHSDVETALKIVAMCESSTYLHTFVPLESIDLQYSDYVYLYLKNGVRAKIPRFSLEPRLHKLASVIKIETGRGLKVKTVDVTLDTAKVPVTYY
ncbi:hypothetical protein PDESU_03853 [Pontiella desulfatans]|uniref:POTRA domain-containing protein n=1 Tax=Pontiella desulfatans TaxID=2750659 RepID=A0A6C2U6W8_PONDE|nr:FtsQ-type POTRA domain-containing protein [Pontiella desulfatans]VGO15271.1 hypothetical protein PDESU_03853 [Pontiella desulfatans]